MVKLNANEPIETCDMSKRKLIPAKDIRINDRLIRIDISSSNENERLLSTKVTQIELIESIGFYAPLTSSGNLIVNNILTSCHSDVKCPTRLQQVFFRCHETVQKLFNTIISLVRQQHSTANNDNLIELSSFVSYFLRILKFILPTEILSH